MEPLIESCMHFAPLVSKVVSQSIKKPSPVRGILIQKDFKFAQPHKTTDRQFADKTLK